MLEDTSETPATPDTAGDVSQPRGTTQIPEIEKYRIEKAYKLSLYGLITVTFLAAGLVIATFFGFSEAGEVSQVVSPFLVVLGTLVGTFFGVQVGSAGREEAEQNARDANSQATAFAAASDPTKLTQALGVYNELTRSSQ